MTNDIEKSKAKSASRNAHRKLGDAIKWQEAIPAPQPNEPKHQTARRTRAKEKVKGASGKVAGADRKVIDLELPPSEAQTRSKPRI